MSQKEIDPTALAIIGRTPAVVRALLDGLPRELTHAPNEDGWSLRDIVAHLHDVESGAFTERIERMLDAAQERPFIRSIDPPARLAAGGYASRDIDDLLDELTRKRSEHVEWLANLTPEQLQREGQHDEAGLIRVVDIAHQWAAHDLSHLRQIAFMIQQYLAPKMGATRAFYDA